MASLQRTFRYQGDPSQIPISNVTLEFHIPEFSYFSTNENYANFKRHIDGYSKVSLSQGLREEEYRVQVPTTLIVGEQLNSKYGYFRYHKIEPLVYDDIKDFVFKIKYIIADEYGNDIGEKEFDAIYGIKSTPINDYRSYRQEVNEYGNRYGMLNDVNAESLEALCCIQQNG